MCIDSRASLPTFSCMAKKPNPNREAEDKLFKSSTPKARALLKESRKLQRDQQRREWYSQRGGN